jgi:hypothetical protein
MNAQHKAMGYTAAETTQCVSKLHTTESGEEASNHLFVEPLRAVLCPHRPELTVSAYCVVHLVTLMSLCLMTAALSIQLIMSPLPNLCRHSTSLPQTPKKNRSPNSLSQGAQPQNQKGLCMQRHAQLL